jgi:trimethylamine-N-oxide reductase (cytochrome c)
MTFVYNRVLEDSVNLDRIRFRAVLFALDKVLAFRARQDLELAARLRHKNLTVQMKLRDESLARYLVFEDGKVSDTKAAIPGHPDVVMAFQNAKIAARLTRPRRNQLDFVTSVMNFKLLLEGPDELVIWFSETLSMALTGRIEYGVDAGKGVKRYTNNTNGGPIFVYVKEGKILRITPIQFDEKDPEPWTIEARGRLLSPPKKASVSPHAMTLKSMVYSSDRILYPMKRVDFDPNGPRNCQARGISGYERISWDEALDLVAGEIVRMKEQYGPGAIMTGSGSHHTFGVCGYWLSALQRFANTVGMTKVASNPDSWEGWFWGGLCPLDGGQLLLDPSREVVGASRLRTDSPVRQRSPP